MKLPTANAVTAELSRLGSRLRLLLPFLFFLLWIQPAPSAPQSTATGETAYLFSYFIGNGEDGLHLAWSQDAYQWKALRQGRSFLTPQVGESKLMRDPCLLRAPDGTFHLVWTTAWKGKTIGYAHSRDLIHWSEQKALPVMAQEPNANNCWAPDLFFDRTTGQYLIFWATTLLAPGAPPPKEGDHRLYYTATRDFETFSPTKLFFDPGYSVIDGTMLEFGGRFRLVFKDERLGPSARKFLQIAESAHASGPWEKITPPFTPSWVEGPTCLQVGEEVVVYFDCYRDHHYGAMKSKDLQHWDDVTRRLSMPEGVRHGTALAVPSAAVEVLLRAENASTNAARSASVPTLWLIGDSTVNNSTKGQQGWGGPIAGFFDTARIRVQNRARGGRSSRTYSTEGLWDQVRDALQPGDFVLLQFGHNDGGSLTDGRARASLKGVGEETREVELQAAGKKEVVHTYGWYLRQYVRDTKAKGATPIVLSLVPRNIWKEGRVVRAAGDYAAWAAQVAREEQVPFIDLNELIAARYEAAGQEKVQSTYFTLTDHTHTTPAGAQLNAETVVQGIKALNQCSLASFLARTGAEHAR